MQTYQRSLHNFIEDKPTILAYAIRSKPRPPGLVYTLKIIGFIVYTLDIRTDKDVQTLFSGVG